MAAMITADDANIVTSMANDESNTKPTTTSETKSSFSSSSTTTTTTNTTGQFPFFPSEAEMWGRPNTLTEKESQSLAEFRTIIPALELREVKMANEADDACLLRVLRADDFQVSVCKEAWDKSMKWRRKHRLWDRLNDSATDIIFNGKISLDDIVRKYPFGVKGRDKKGRPISYKLAGKTDQSIFDEVGVENLIQWEAVVASKTVHYLLPKCAVESGYHVENYAQIVDLDGISVTSFGSNMKTAIKGSIKLCGDNFPETMGATYIINAPWYFRTIWAVVRTFIEPETVKKVHVFSSPDELKSVIDLDMLPVEYGGTGKLGLGSLNDLYTPEACWELEAGRPDSWGPDPFAIIEQ